ncbi:MAG: hypothetical protein HQL72_05285 [Magnetococcales bacterium]|nr:hypothetical protein [Magnetococcales bacterium]
MNIPETEFPESLVEIKDIIGYEGAMTLLNHCAGTRLFIPKKIKIQHKLSQLLGLEQAQLMSRYFGGETLSIARAAKAKRANRNREIIRLYDSGGKVPDIARKMELTERQIYTILSRCD